MSKLDDARREINSIDKEMAALFERRMDAVKKVADYKREHSLPVEDLAREQAVIENNCALIKNEEYKSYYVNYQNAVMSVSKSYQHCLLLKALK